MKKLLHLLTAAAMIAGSVYILQGCQVSPTSSTGEDTTATDTATRDTTTIRFALWDVCATGHAYDYRGDSIPFEWSVVAILSGDTVEIGADSAGCVDIGAHADTTHFELLETWATAGSYEHRYFRAGRAFEFEIPWRRVPLRVDTLFMVSDSLQREMGW